MRSRVLPCSAVGVALALLISLPRECRAQAVQACSSFILQWGQYGYTPGDFAHPWDVVVDSDGTVLVADMDNCRIQRFTSEGQFLAYWILPTLPIGIRAKPLYLAVGDGYLYITSAYGYILKYTRLWQLIAQWPLQTTPSGVAPAAFGVAVGSDGNIFVADYGNQHIQKFTPDGQFLLRWGTAGGGPGQFSKVKGLAADRAGHLFALDAGGPGAVHRVQVFDLNGNFLYQWGGWEVDPLPDVYDVAVDQDGDVYVSGRGYVSDQLAQRVWRFSPDGTFLCTWSSPSSGPGTYFGGVGIGLDSSGHVYVTDSDGSCVKKFGTPPVMALPTTWGRLKATYR